MKIDTPILDMGGVLVWTRWENVTTAWCDLSGLAPQAVVGRIAAGSAYRPFMRCEIDCAEFRRRMCTELGIDQEPTAFYETWRSAIGPNSAIAPLIARLKGRVRLAIGSNTDELHHGRGLEVQPALELFDDYVLSFETGVLKRDPEFFDRGLQQLRVLPEQCFFTDDRQDNVEAAQGVRIRAVRFRSVPQLESELRAIGAL